MHLMLPINDGYLDNNKTSCFYVAQYWADALANGANAELAEQFAPIVQGLKYNKATIIEELLSVERKAQDTSGYYNYLISFRFISFLLSSLRVERG